MVAHSPHFEGTQRFEVVRLLGAGGMGEVYEVHDHENDMRTALKVLRWVDARLLYRFKREFRALQELTHPNLAALGQLYEQGGLWFFTMELVDGVTFLNHVWGEKQTGPIDYAVTVEREDDIGWRPPRVPRPVMRPDEGRLLPAFRQLCEALRFLHESGKVHRDVKPSNVLVTPAGRVVLLDFGLVAEAHPDLQSVEGDIVGTPAYMAPEQAACHRVDHSADCYALGVLLYEALTGQLPFEGRPTEILLKKQGATPPDPRALKPETPEELARLCRWLLDPEPSRRATAAQALEVLGGKAPPRISSSSLTRAPVFVGREPELRTLRSLLAEVMSAKSPHVVEIEGQSGVGKSLLIHQFCARLAAERDDMLVLSGRCYEREMTHYRAFDGVVDALVRHLWTLSPTDQEALTPPSASFLTRMFPMFDGVHSFASALRVPRSATSERDSRRHAYGALREFLRRLGGRWTLVVVIDDVQWADNDSRRLLSELLRGPDAPPALFVLATRPRGDDPRDIKASVVDPLPIVATQLPLAPLDPRLAEELARTLLTSSGVVGSDGAAAIASEAGGHPLHIAELVRHASETGGAMDGTLRLDEAILTRLRRLSDGAQQIAELLSVAGAPMRPATLRRAADAPPLEFARALSALRLGNLARRSGIADDELVEPYHDRVREAVLAQLDDDKRRGLHERLAAAMTAGNEPPELLLRHLVGARQIERAAQCALQSAQRASSSMAYDRAAELYRIALRLGTFVPDEERALRIRLGEELVQAGRGHDAAEVFMAAAEGADPATRLNCHLQAAEQLLITGYIDEGLATVEALLAEVNTPLPKTPRRALASLIYNRAALALRGRRWKLRRETEVARERLSQLDVYKAVSHGLSMVDNIRGADFNARYLRLALATGEPIRLCRALGTEAIFLGSQGNRSLGKARRLVSEVERLGTEAEGAYAHAWSLGVSGCLHYFDGRYFPAAEALRESEERFRELRITEGYELNNLRMFRAFSLGMAGAVTRLEPLYEQWVSEAQQRGDRYAETVLRRRGGIIWLARGDVGGALAQGGRANWMPPEGRFHLQHWYEIAARVEAALCLEMTPDVVAAVDGGVARMAESMLSRVQSVRCIGAWLQARARLATVRDNRGSDADARAAAEWAGRAARRLRAEGVSYARLFADLTDASAGAFVGDETRAVTHLRAVTAAATADTRVYAAVAHHRLAKLVGGAAGRAHQTAALQQAAQLGITSLDTIADLMAPFRR